MDLRQRRALVDVRAAFERLDRVVKRDPHAFDDPDHPAADISPSLDFVARAIWRAARVGALTGSDPIVARAREWIRWRQTLENRPWLRRARVGLEGRIPRTQVDAERYATILGWIEAGKSRSEIQKMLGYRSRQALHKELVRLEIMSRPQKRQPKPSSK